MTNLNHKEIAEALNVQLKGVQDLDSLSAGLRLAIITIGEELQEKDDSFDKLQFEHDCYKFTKFSDGGKKLQARETYMMS